MRTGGFDMRGSVEGAVAVAPRDVASSSPSKNNASALDMIRYQQRITPDVLPVANGSSSGSSGSSASRKLPMPAPAPRSSADVHDAPADSSRLASYLGTASLEQHKPRARAPHFPPPPASSSSLSAAGAVVIRSPALEHAYQPPDFADHTAPNSSSVNRAAPDVSVRLQWGHNKRSRGRRDAPLLPTPSPDPTPAQETPAQARRRASIKIQRRNAAAAAAASASAPASSADKLLMPPPSTRGGPIIRVASSLPPRAAAVAAADALYGRTLQHQRSAEEQPRASAGAGAGAEHQQQPHPHPSPAPKQHQRPQRAASDKEKGKAPVTAATPEQPPKKHQQAAAEVQKLVAAARPELPRIQTTLSRREKEEDFLAMKGTKLPQRPKKRTKAVDKAVSQIYPGQWLSEVSRTRYMVREKKSKKQKRGGGLKAMDSDSDY